MLEEPLRVAAAAAILLALGLPAAAGSAKHPKVGSACAKAGAKATASNGAHVRCAKAKGRLRWIPVDNAGSSTGAAGGTCKKAGTKATTSSGQPLVCVRKGKKLLWEPTGGAKSGGGSAAGGSGPGTSITDTSIFPFAYTISSDGYLDVTVGSQEFPAEFGSWGAHNLVSAGGHIEGNNKSNFRVHILPAGKTVEIEGNGNGVCDAGELCGATLADIKANELWYTATYPHMQLTALEHDVNQDTSPYVPGEGTEWREFFSFDGGLTLAVQHTGELSPALIQLIKDSGQASALNVTSYTQLAKPVSVPAGIELARPQIIDLESKQVNGQTVYAADAQVEWSLQPTSPTDRLEHCEWNYFTAAVRTKFQALLDTELTRPQPHGWFSGYPGAESASEGTLCASDAINTIDNYSQISSNNSFGFYEVNGASHTTGQVFAVFPIHTDSAAYRADQSLFAPGAAFMFRLGDDPAGFPASGDPSLVLSEGGQSYTLTEVVGEVVDLGRAADTTANDHFTVRIDRVSANAVGPAPALAGRYFGVRYRLESDKVVVAFGGLADTQSGVVLPAAIPTGASCDATAYHCYIHDFTKLR